ncbi:putative peptidoglycan binding protein [Scopulibacillus darangshiensis]|uniref:Putative peptidoglycan binding protein n=1 Tax=Scopulibacillus darangshiensis TaxID=442528 RepID=A0A4V2SNE1_9BACL|nr:NlpC/P60 family protein [Scopulibacillus darangshiensis]TCP30916.1 putative peptidoglycan binding protein [Scopulibacillus darangshiensis]
MLKPKKNNIKRFVATTAVIGSLTMSSFAFHSGKASAHAPSLSDHSQQSEQTASGPVHSDSSKLLKAGDRGDAVSDVQSKLDAKGYGLAVDGIFGPNTEDAVRQFQGDKGLAVDGIVGPDTREALGTSDQGSGHTTSDVVSIAEGLVGSPYKWGGTTPNGFDCSGFLDYVYQKVGIDLPRTTNDIYKAGTKVSSPSPGDIVFFDNTYGNYGSGYATHAGVYVGNGKIVHAGSDGVVESDLSIDYWQNHLLGYRSYQK